jgi:hypothetical protein
MQLLELTERVKNKKPFNTHTGTIDRVFEIYERGERKMDGLPYEFIKPDLIWRHTERPIR